MDPDATLEAARKAAKAAYEAHGYEELSRAADDLVAAFEALDRWMLQGGFPPAEWGQ